MSPHEPSDNLRRLLNDAVDQIEPRSGIEAIRSRTSLSKGSAITTARNWILGGLGAAAATAAVISGVVLAGNNHPTADNDPGPVDTPSGQASDMPSEDPTDDPTKPTDDPTASDVPTDAPTTGGPLTGPAVPVYYVGDTPNGPRLYLEFQTGSGDKATAAADLAVSGTPLDPDYRTPWPAGTHVNGVAYNGDFITVDVVGDVHDRPARMSQETAALAIEQVIYTVQGAFGEGRVPVQFTLNTGRTDQVLGQPASEPLANAPENDVLAQVNVTTPEEGATVSGTIKATGRANSFEANVPIEIQRGDEVVKTTFATAEGAMGKLYPWAVSVDVSDLPPGEYTFVAMTDDASGGAEGTGAHRDTKNFTIQ
jgi:hypothetical protein